MSDQGQLGTGSTEDKLDPIIVEGLQSDIVEIASGDKHCLAVTELGDVYVWGRGREGQHGNGERAPYITSPIKVHALDSERIVKVICGTRNCLAINQEGEVFSWGMMHRFNAKSATEYFGERIEMPGMKKKEAERHGDHMEEWERKRAEMLARSHQKYYSAGMVTVTADEESLAANATQDRVTHEITNFGQFQAYLQATPVPIRDLAHVKVRGGAAGYSFNLVYTEEGHVYGWGFNEKRQLGLGHRFNQEHPQLNKTLYNAGAKIIKIACGQQHVLALADDGSVWSWGLGVLGQLGHGETHDEGVPRKIAAFDGIKIVDIACGSQHSLALTDTGKIYSWGSSEYGQQGGRNQYTDWEQGFQHTVGKRKYYYAEPRELVDSFDGKKVVKIGCGALHNIALTENGDVYTWGWGINGALGHGNRNFQHQPRVVAKLRGEKVALIAAGTHSTMVATLGGNTSFAFDFKHLVNKSYYHDITFEVQGKLVPAHQAIVFTRCLYLRQVAAIFRRAHGDSVPVKVDGIEYFVFLALLRYLYTDHLSAAPHHVPKLLKAAIKMRLPRLAALCERFIMIDDAPIIQGDMSSIPQKPIPSSVFAEEMKDAVDGSDFSDVCFVLSDGSTIYAHKAMLVSRSDFFKTIFEGSFAEKGASIISLPDIDRTTFLAVLRYIYTNDISFVMNEEVDVVEVLIAAGRFLLESLKQKIEKKLEDQLEAENTLNLLQISEATNTPKLRKSCERFVMRHYDEVRHTKDYQTLAESSPEFVKKIDIVAQAARMNETLA